MTVSCGCLTLATCNPFDPLREFNSNGTQDPMFHAVERFETRFFFGWLLSKRTDREPATDSVPPTETTGLWRVISAKWIGYTPSRRLHKCWRITAKSLSVGKRALSSEHALAHLFQLEAFRSHVLDIEDDLHGQSCTPLTLKRIDYVLDVIVNDYPNIAQHGGLFYANHGKSATQLTNDYQRKRELVQQYQLR